jgi:hypothetical protein
LPKLQTAAMVAPRSSIRGGGVSTDGGLTLPAGELWVAVAVVLVLLALMSAWLLVRRSRRR